MEKAVVRRGIGAVVLALIAALLLGYLLKGKAPQRSEVAKTELNPSEIQIFPQGGNGEGQTADKTQTGAADEQSKGEGQSLLGKAAGAVSAAAKMVGLGGDDKSAGDGKGKAPADSNAPSAGAGEGSKAAMENARGKMVDAVTGNAATSKNNVLVDNAGQAEKGNKETGKGSTPGSFVFRPSQQKEVRPSVSGAELDKGGSKLAAASASKPKIAANAKLVGEKPLSPVGGSAKAPAPKETKVASSKNTAPTSKPVSRNTATSSTSVASSAPAGRNKYVVQLLATSSKNKANQLRNQMKREGYAAFVSTTASGGKTLYRVRIGGFDGKSAALKKQNALKRRYRENPFVQSSIVLRN